MIVVTKKVLIIRIFYNKLLNNLNWQPTIHHHLLGDLF